MGGNAMYLSLDAADLFLKGLAELEHPDQFGPEKVKAIYSHLRTQMKVDLGVYTPSDARVQIPKRRNGSRIGATCAIAGAALLFVGTYLHPQGADPNEAVAAFTEYAADHLWVASHLMQLAGIALIVAALLFLAQQLESGSGTGWSRIASAGAIVSLALTAALQAVDGIALKTMVDAWAAVPAAQKEVVFLAAFAIRQVEIGLASMLSILFGLTATVYGIALLVDHTYSKWIGGLAIVGGALMAIAGVVMAYTGFSGLAMAMNMSASFILLVWMMILGALMWRREGNLAR
jgi:hypothetical protein